jgi:hypothetical protein
MQEAKQLNQKEALKRKLETMQKDIEETVDSRERELKEFMYELCKAAYDKPENQEKLNQPFRGF